jgi:polar amino acid transport system substrate-binding protein
MKKTLFLIFVYFVNCNVVASKVRAVTEDLPPYQIVVDGKLVAGSSFLLVQEMLKRADLDVPVQVYPWPRAYAIASSEPDTLIFSISRNLERENKFVWLLKLESFIYEFYALSSRMDLKVNSIDEMLKHTVVTVRGSNEANSLHKLGFKEGTNLILTPNYSDAWQMVLKNRADYTYASHFMKENQLNNMLEENVFKPIESDPDKFSIRFTLNEKFDLYIAANVQFDPMVLQKLKLSLVSMQQDKTLHKLFPGSELAF